VVSPNTRGGRREKAYRSCQKHKSLSLHYFISTGLRLLHVPFKTSLKSNLRTVQVTQTTTQNNCTISHTQNTTALQPNVFLTGTYWSQIRDGRLCPTQTAKVNCKLLSQYQLSAFCPQLVIILMEVISVNIFNRQSS
jgi:hypothetical protein